MANHDWLLLAPWYKWSNPATARATVPVLQKYDAADFVNAFLRDPQASLAFLDREGDSGPPGEDQAKDAADALVRKIFLGSHKRFYVVAFELHCDVAGLPNANRADVCSAGFVVRRPRPARADDRARAAAQQDAAQRALDDVAAEERAFVPWTGPGAPSAESQRDAFLAKKRTERARARELLRQAKAIAAALASHAQHVVEGWIASRTDPTHGSWQLVTEQAEEIVESAFPAYPLVADPRDPNHAAYGRTIYFGVVPSGAADLDDTNSPRFDARSTYEIRSFARRRKPECPPPVGRDAHCTGDLFFSAPTEKYVLASFFDLVGTSYLPVTIQMPNVREMKDVLTAQPPAQPAAVRLVSLNKSSNLRITSDGKTLPPTLEDVPANQEGPGETCTYAIPLLMIVATFVFRLFLMILMIPLAFLLNLKFCFPTGASLPRVAGPRFAPRADRSRAEVT